VKLRTLLLLLALLFCNLPHSYARLLVTFTYEELFAKSDLVVIATPMAKTADTREQSSLPNISTQHEDGTSSEVKSIGLETAFKVSVVLKGDKNIKRFVLHHYREAESSAVVLNGPILVSFDPSDAAHRFSFLLFLMREQDGRYAPAGGQTDPGYKSISRLPLD